MSPTIVEGTTGDGEVQRAPEKPVGGLARDNEACMRSDERRERLSEANRRPASDGEANRPLTGVDRGSVDVAWTGVGFVVHREGCRSDGEAYRKSGEVIMRAFGAQRATARLVGDQA